MSKCKHRDEEFTEEQMARWHSKGIRQTQCQVCHRWFWPHEWKPKPKCEIIPKKPRMVRVKAWVGPRALADFMTDDRMGIMFSNWFNGSHCSDNIPVTIIIDRKYITTRKGEK